MNIHKERKTKNSFLKISFRNSLIKIDQNFFFFQKIILETSKQNFILGNCFFLKTSNQGFFSVFYLKNIKKNLHNKDRICGGEN